MHQKINRRNIDDARNIKKHE